MWIARSAPFGERFANRLRRARRSGTQRDHFTAVLFLFKLQRLFQRVSVRFVDLETQIAFLNPFALTRLLKLRRIARRELV